jgi:UDPglucose 6-dehydrogenase
MDVGIVGYGKVVAHLDQMLRSAGFETKVYDRYKEKLSSVIAKGAVNRCKLVFLSVPTPNDASGNCNLSEIHEALSWIERPICIKSTVTPGTTDRLVREYRKAVVVSPEYTGETPYHRYRHETPADVVAIGGNRDVARLFIEIYKMVLGPAPRYFIADARTVELAKYMENCFFATKVSFVAQFYLLAQAFGADFDLVREIWTADPRIGVSHSTVIDSLGFGGKCLPKDLMAIISCARESGGAPLLEAVDSFNKSLTRSNILDGLIKEVDVDS